VLLPLLDILQSVPVLGFLVVIVSFFLSLFPNSCRYAELFEYDAKTQQFCVEREAEQGAA
jgi:hypothetical protein